LNVSMILPLISSIVAFIFALTVLDQFLARRKPYQLVWAVGLFMYFISTGGGIQLFYLFELLGIIVIFTGFLRSREVFGLYRFPLIHGFRKIAAD
jgi:hypothetical protein